LFGGGMGVGAKVSEEKKIKPHSICNQTATLTFSEIKNWMV